MSKLWQKMQFQYLYWKHPSFLVISNSPLSLNPFPPVGAREIVVLSTFPAPLYVKGGIKDISCCRSDATENGRSILRRTGVLVIATENGWTERGLLKTPVY